MFRPLFYLEFTFVCSVSPDGEPVVSVPFAEQSATVLATNLKCLHIICYTP
jgi:hypothetical protein